MDFQDIQTGICRKSIVRVESWPLLVDFKWIQHVRRTARVINVVTTCSNDLFTHVASKHFRMQSQLWVNHTELRRKSRLNLTTFKFLAIAGFLIIGFAILAPTPAHAATCDASLDHLDQPAFAPA